MQKKLAEAIVSYNQSIGNDAAAIRNAERLYDDGALAVITGQQLGLFGGPGYTFHKAVSALLLAKEKGAIPIFWLATEDHDIDEIDHTYWIDVRGNLDKFHLSFPKDGTPVEDLVLKEHHLPEIQRFLQNINREDLQFQPGESYALAMARAFATFFHGTGLVFLEPKILRPFAKDFFHAQLKKNPTYLFCKNEQGQRQKIDEESDAMHALIDQEPERFSPNVYARCAMQCALLPTHSYVAGPSEIKYWSELEGYFSSHHLPMPNVVPRKSITMITKEVSELLDLCDLSPIGALPTHFQELFPEVFTQAEELKKVWKLAAQEKLGIWVSDQTITHSLDHALTRLQRKAYVKFLSEKGIPSHALHLLHNFLHPHKKRQERVLNSFALYSHTSVQAVLEKLKKHDEPIYLFLDQ
ncbi:MAG: bacillithiol biosynthesis BshC [Waddliaceae bacterium]